MTFFLLDKKTRSIYFGHASIQESIDNGLYFEGNFDKIRENIIQNRRFLFIEFNQKFQNKIQKFVLIFLSFVFLFCQLKFWSPLIPPINWITQKHLEQENPYSESRILTLLNGLYESKVARAEPEEVNVLHTSGETPEFARFPLLNVRGVKNFLFVTQSAIQKKFFEEKFYLLSNYSEIFTIQNKISATEFCEKNKSIHIFEISNKNFQFFFVKKETKSETQIDSNSHTAPTLINTIVLSSFNSKALQKACKTFEFIHEVKL